MLAAPFCGVPFLSLEMLGHFALYVFQFSTRHYSSYMTHTNQMRKLLLYDFSFHHTTTRFGHINSPSSRTKR